MQVVLVAVRVAVSMTMTVFLLARLGQIAMRVMGCHGIAAPAADNARLVRAPLVDLMCLA
ncbi:MAG TPA: hypothetical protein VF031_04920 [Alphaproteobacteria bacterium]